MRDGSVVGPVGREAVFAAVDRFLASLAQGPAGLLFEGPAGIGKSTMVDAAIEAARRRDIRVLVARPSGAEATWAYQSLADLLSHVGDDALAVLPALQRAALDTVLLRGPAAAADEPAHAQAVAVGATSVLAALARSSPVLIVIDDAPWLDPATAAVLAFAVRRIAALPIGVVAAQRVGEPGAAPLAAPFALDSVLPTERVWLDPLSLGALHLLLADRLGLTLPRPTLRRLQDLCRGNPLHALEIGRALQRLPNLPRPGEPLPIPDSIRDLLRGHIASVGERARGALLVAAAAGSPTVDELRLAAGPATDMALEEATDAGLVAVEAGVVRFTHPSLAAAVYQDASPAARRAVHELLARVVESAEARGRHLALSTMVPKTDVAAALEAGALDAKRRGAIDSAAELARLAVDRTPAGDTRDGDRRTLLLANLLVELPDLPAADDVVGRLIERLPPGSMRAEARLLAGTIAWYAAIDPRRPAEHLLAALPDAAGDAELLGRLRYRLSVFSDFDLRAAREHARAAVDILVGLDAPMTLAAAMFELFATSIEIGEAPDLDLLAQGLAAEVGATHVDQSTVPGLWWLAIDQPDLARDRFSTMLEASRAAGEVSGEPDLLTRLAETELYADRWQQALALAEEATIAARQEGQSNADPARRVRALIHAHLGRLDEARSAAAEGLQRAEEIGDPVIAAGYLAVLAFVAATEGNASETEQFAERSARHLRDTGRIQPLRLDVTHERVEALVVLGRLDEAEDHLTAFEARARIVPRPWADSGIARGRARLLAARGELDEAIARTEVTTLPAADAWRRFDRARTLLVRGELLRQARARRDAGATLDAALVHFDAIGARAWSARARAELARLGRHRPGTEALTPTERQVAELAASGLRNREVAEQLGVSPKTVEAHLARVYGKLGIRSRAELGRAFLHD